MLNSLIFSIIFITCLWIILIIESRWSGPLLEKMPESNSLRTILRVHNLTNFTVLSWFTIVQQKCRFYSVGRSPRRQALSRLATLHASSIYQFLAVLHIVPSSCGQINGEQTFDQNSVKIGNLAVFFPWTSSPIYLSLVFYYSDVSDVS